MSASAPDEVEGVRDRVMRQRVDDAPPQFTECPALCSVRRLRAHGGVERRGGDDASVQRQDAVDPQIELRQVGDEVRYEEPRLRRAVTATAPTHSLRATAYITFASTDVMPEARTYSKLASRTCVCAVAS